MCQTWPHCRCIVQGYVNIKEPNSCGRKPRNPENARVAPRMSFIEALLG